MQKNTKKEKKKHTKNISHSAYIYALFEQVDFCPLLDSCLVSRRPRSLSLAKQQVLLMN